jgi:hypothetical protein
MKHCSSKRSVLVILIVGALLLPAIVAVAQPSEGSSTLLPSGPLGTVGIGYDLSWWTVDGGGTTFSRGGGYALGGTAGQPDAGSPEGSGYTLDGGFWGGALTRQYHVYLPLVMR